MRIKFEVELDRTEAEMLAEALSEKWSRLRGMLDNVRMPLPGFPDTPTHVISAFQERLDAVERLYKDVAEWRRTAFPSTEPF
jgi:hypothetical protein